MDPIASSMGDIEVAADHGCDRPVRTRTWLRLSLITAISVLASLLISVALNGLMGRSGEELLRSAVIAVCVPLLIAPTSSWVFYGMVDKLNELNWRLVELNRRDPLTAVFNRREFMRLVEQDLLLASRHRVPVALLMIDYDQFKQLNDSHGHRIGDEVLIASAGVMQSVLREGDRLARYGGEEFIILLNYNTDPAGVAERIRQTLADCPFEVGNKTLGITVSIGCATWTGPEEPLAQLIERADQALLVAKKCGRNRVVVAEALATGDGDKG